MSPFRYEDLGLIAYAPAYERQLQLFNQALEHKRRGLPVEQVVLFCEHPHVITLGKYGEWGNLLFPEEMLREKAVALFHTDRGGDITYHGPGQLVVYPIFDLEAMGIGLKEYIGRLEEVIIRLLSDYDIPGERLPGAPGVWLDVSAPQGRTRKVAAIGVRSSRYVSMHGFALNVNTDLSYFELINPCGFVDKGVTSMAAELNKKLDFSLLKSQVLRYLKEAFA